MPSARKSGGRRGRRVGASAAEARGRGGFAVFLVRRLISGVALLAAVTAATFVLISSAPGDTAQVLAGQAGADEEYLVLIRERLQLNRPLPYQISSYVKAAAQGDLGYSLVQGRPVRDAILDRLPASLLLAGTALAFAALIGVTLGSIAGSRRGGSVDAAISLASLLAYSLPVFWLGQLLVALFAVRLHWLPAGGIRSAEDPGGVVDVLRHLILPAGTLALLLVPLLVRVTRTSVIDALGQEYVMVARAKGLSERQVLLRHALPNALRPVVTILTGYLGLVLTGAVLVETVFVWPGLGRLLYDAVLARDTPMLAGLLIVSASLVVVANLIADIIYRVLDPRTDFR